MESSLFVESVGLGLVAGVEGRVASQVVGQQIADRLAPPELVFVASDMDICAVGEGNAVLVASVLIKFGVHSVRQVGCPQFVLLLGAEHGVAWFLVGHELQI